MADPVRLRIGRLVVDHALDAAAAQRLADLIAREFGGIGAPVAVPHLSVEGDPRDPAALARAVRAALHRHGG